VRALKRIFILCDNDKDGALSDVELNDFQVFIHEGYSTFYVHQQAAWLFLIWLYVFFYL